MGSKRSKSPAVAYAFGLEDAQSEPKRQNRITPIGYFDVSENRTNTGKTVYWMVFPAVCKKMYYASLRSLKKP